MGVGPSGEQDSLEEDRGPHNERYLHWLLSEPDRVQEAFTPVWKACSSDNPGPVSKASVLEVMLRVVDEFEGTAGALLKSEGSSTTAASGAEASDDSSGRTARQLVRAVDMLPDKLTKAEALYLFRTALLAVQSALVMRHGHSGPVSMADSPPADREGPGSPGGEDGLAADGSPGLRLPTPGSPSPTMRASSRAEDLSPARPLRPLTGKRLHPALAALPPMLAAQLFQGRASLPSRKELEVESEQLRRLCEQVDASSRSELAVVRELEAEVAARREALNERRADGTYGNRSTTDDEAVRSLQLKLRAHQQDLASQDATISAQKTEIQALLANRSHEEMEADELSREARDVTMELRSCRRTCGSLESEIASEEARAAALREAFEGRRARFATAETAARNAELSTMRATRRRIAAEVAARREAEAVEDAMQARSEQSVQAAVSSEAISSEIAELRARSSLLQDQGAKSLGFQQASALSSILREVAEAEREQASEVACAEASAKAVAELEVASARLEGQLAARESELYAMQRRALRTTSLQRGGSRTPPRSSFLHPAAEDPQNLQVASELQAAETRVAEGRRREQVLREQLQQLLASKRSNNVGNGAHAGEDLNEASMAAWQQARELSAELGEAHAALARRRAQEQQPSSKEVVSTLRSTLQDAEAREARSLEELAQLRSEAVQDLSEEAVLRQRLAAANAASVGKAAVSSKAPAVAFPSEEPATSQGWLPSLMPSWLMGSSAPEEGRGATTPVSAS